MRQQAAPAQVQEQEESSYLSLQGIHTISSHRNPPQTYPLIASDDWLLCAISALLAGVSKLRERWTGALGRSRQRRRRGNGVSLFVSPNAEYVAVTVGNQIIILRKGDDYSSPCGVYTSE